MANWIELYTPGDSAIAALARSYRDEARAAAAEAITARDLAMAQTTYTAPVAGAVTRPIQARLSDCVSVLDFGAQRGGLVNAAPAFNAAIRSGRTLYVPDGDYLIATTLGRANLRDFGMVLGAGARLIHAATLSGKMMQFDNGERIRITSLGLAKIDLSAAPRSLPGQANDGIYFAGGAGCTDVEVDHLWFYSGASHETAGGDSQIFFAGSNGHFHHNVHEGAWDLGVYTSGAGGVSEVFSSALVESNRFINCLNACGSKRRFGGLRFVDNVVTGGVNGAFSGEADASNLPGRRNIYARNRFEGLAGAAIISRISDFDIITENQFINGTGGAIIALQGATRAIVSNNQIVIDPEVYASPATQTAIRVEARTFNSVTYHSTDNRIQNNAISGVFNALREADVAQDRNTYDGNVIVGAIAPSVLLGPKSYITTAQTRRLQGVPVGFQGTERVDTQVALQTTTGSLLNAFTLPMPGSRQVRISAVVSGNTSGASAYGVRLEATFRRHSGGNITQVGETAVSGEHSDYPVLPGALFFADVGVQGIRLRVQGLAGTNIDWLIDVTYTILATEL